MWHDVDLYVWVPSDADGKKEVQKSGRDNAGDLGDGHSLVKFGEVLCLSLFLFAL